MTHREIETLIDNHFRKTFGSRNRKISVFFDRYLSVLIQSCANDAIQLKTLITTFVSRKTNVDFFAALKKRKIIFDPLITNHRDFFSILHSTPDKNWFSLAKLFSKDKLNQLLYSENRTLTLLADELGEKFSTFINAFEPDIRITSEDSFQMLLEKTPETRGVILSNVWQNPESYKLFVEEHYDLFLGYLPIEERVQFAMRFPLPWRDIDSVRFLSIIHLLPTEFLAERFIDQYARQLASRPDLIDSLIVDAVQTKRSQLAFCYLALFERYNVTNTTVLLSLIMQLKLTDAETVYQNCKPGVQQALQKQFEASMEIIQTMHEEERFWQWISAWLHHPLSMSYKNYEHAETVWEDELGHYEGQVDAEGHFIGVGFKDTFEPGVIAFTYLLCSAGLFLLGLPISLAGTLIEKLEVEPARDAMQEIAAPIGVEPAVIIERYQEWKNPEQNPYRFHSSHPSSSSTLAPEAEPRGQGPNPE